MHPPPSPCLFLLQEAGLLEDHVTEGVDLKKYTTWKLQVKSYPGQNEDFSPGDSISDSSEKLLQRDSGEGQYVCDFGEGGVHALKNIFFLQKVFTVLKDHASPLKILVLLYTWGGIRIGLIKSAPENIYLEACSASLLEYRVPHFCSLPWAPLRGYWRSATSIAHDLTPVEEDGKCQFVVDRGQNTGAELVEKCPSNSPGAKKPFECLSDMWASPILGPLNQILQRRGWGRGDGRSIADFMEEIFFGLWIKELWTHLRAVGNPGNWHFKQTCLFPLHDFL